MHRRRWLLAPTFALVLGAMGIARPTLRAQVAGDLDRTFQAGTDGQVASLSLQADGRIVLGGRFSHVNGLPHPFLARLEPDGKPDEGFIATADGPVLTVVVQPDGKTVLGGFFSQVNGVPSAGITRLNADGSVDQGFTPVTNGVVECLVLQPDGKIILGGFFSQVNGTMHIKIARLNVDGSVDAGFGANADPGSDLDNSTEVYSLAVQSDGRVIMGGSFVAVNGQARRGIARLEPDGSLDTSFTASAPGGVYCLALQADGKILLGGSFAYVNGIDHMGFARLNPDGSLDPAIPGAGSDVTCVVAQPDGNILLGGGFTQIGDTRRNRVARLHADGSVDLSFDPGAGPDGEVRTLSVQPDGKPIIGGTFSKVNTQPRSAVARLLGDNAGAPVVAPFFSGATDVGGGFSYLSGFGYFKLLADSPGYVFHNDLGFLYYIDANDGKGGIYFYDFATPAGAKSLGFFYTAPSFPFPYLYSFELKSFLYYFPDPKRGPGFYSTGPRVFVRLDTGEFLFR